MKIAVFWVVAPCSLVEVYQRFRGPCCLHHQGDDIALHGATTQKTAIFTKEPLALIIIYAYWRCYVFDSETTNMEQIDLNTRSVILFL
jgi:hypothetical protein